MKEKDKKLEWSRWRGRTHLVRAWAASNGRSQQKPPSARQRQSTQGKGQRIVPTGLVWTLQVLDRPPYSPDLVFCELKNKTKTNNNNNNNNNPDLNRRCSWQDGNLSRSGTSHKPSFQSSMLYLSRTIKMLFISGWGGWNIVWLVQNCTDFRELVGVVDWPFDRVNDWITDLSLSLCPSPHACACVWIWLSVCLSLCLSLILLW